MARQRILALAMVFGLIASACGDAESTSVDVAVEGVATTISGSQIDLGALEGQDTVLWFWAPW